MKTRWWLLLLSFVFAAGWFSGRQSPAFPEGVTASPQAGTTARPANGRTATPGDREPGRQRWTEKIGSAEMSATDLIREIPAKDRGAALEAWLKSPGNRFFGAAEAQRLQNLLDAWVAEDPGAALEWAAALDEPAMRELAMTGVAGAMAPTDPQGAFECLVRHGEFKSNIKDFRITSLMKQLSQDALKQGPAALAELWQRLPGAANTVNERYGVNLDYPPGTDFRALQEALRDTTVTSSSKPIFLSGVVEAWMKQDPEGAISQLAERIAAKEKVTDSWGEIYWAKKNELGKAGAEQWASDMIGDMPGDARGKFLMDTRFLASEGRIATLAQNSDSAVWIAEALQYDADNGGREVDGILSPLPEARRIEFLKTLRGSEAARAAGSAMTGWNFTESQQAEVRKAINGN
ncbi:MAG: hypothetical protein JWO82_3613 [Akkermansiaceae bacterium]|nr:hypothetical protein [Akkermansiaceae bacterium]